MSYVYTTIILGIVISLIFTELTGISAGGIVVPAYLALTVNQPSILISTLSIGIMAYVVVEFGLSRIMMLYGKRKFVALILTALIFRIIINIALRGVFDDLDALTSVGVVTAALIASTISKQGVKYTLVGAVSVTAIVYVLVELIAMV